MIFKLFRRNANEALIARIHGEIMAQARNPVLFLDYGVADTPEGRFEMVALHVLLAVRRLQQLPAPGPDIAQDITDEMFRHFDIAFREMGVADTTVPKRMKKYASAWMGRARAYGLALDTRDVSSLSVALARNVYGVSGGDDEHANRLSRYILANELALVDVDAGAFLTGPLLALPPETIF